MLEELLNLRKEFVKKRERFRILNHHYNELLIKKHTLNEQNNSFPAIEKSKAYKIMRIVHNVICLFVGTMFVFETIGLGIFITCIILTAILGATFEDLLLPKIVYGKDYKVLKNLNEAKTKSVSKEEAEELFLEMDDAREEYHKLRHILEEKELELQLNNASDYQEYLEIVDKVIEEYESTYSEKDDITKKYVKELNLV